MPVSQVALLAILGLTLVVAVVITVAVLRHAPRSRADEPLGRGAFREALAAAAERPEGRLAAATAARHLLELEQARELLDGLLGDDPLDGEALVERGLVAAYSGQLAAASGYLERAAAVRSDLAESITLHRAWLALRRGRDDEARRRFEEVEAPLESKLRGDLLGDPLFAEWYLHASLLWRAAGDEARAAWAWRAGLAAAPESRLAEALGPAPATAASPARPGRPLE